MPGDDCAACGRLLSVHHHSSGRLLQFQLGAHLLNLRSLIFYCCHESRNRGFQFRDRLLLFLEFFEACLGLGAVRTAYSHLLATGRQVWCLSDHRYPVHGEGGASTNVRPVNASDVRVLIRSPAGANATNGNDILIAGKTGIADVNIIADNCKRISRMSPPVRSSL